MRKRTIRKIIRFRHYGKMEDPQNYYREQLMLFVPWRNEEVELLDASIDIPKSFSVSEKIIHENSKPFYFNPELNDESLANIVNDIQDDLERHDEDSRGVQNEMELMEADMGFEENFDEDITTGNVRVEQFLPPRTVPDNVYRSLMRTLNEKQRRFVLNSLHLLKINASPFYYFLSGRAGVGKSHAVMAIVQSYMRYCGKLLGVNPDHYCVLVAAPTGKAAFNVFGMTLHSTFKLPPTQYTGKLCDLDDGALSTVRKNLIGVKLFIIDEISMVSVNMFYEVGQRLRQIYATTDDFGGRSIIVVITLSFLKREKLLYN
jgi:DNA replication protein DnaC